MKKKIIGGIVIGVTLLVIVLATMGLPGSQAKTGAGQGGIAVIYVEGAIVGGRSDSLFGGIAGSTTLMKQLREAARDPWVKAVVLRLNTPGGSAPASQEIGDEISGLKETGKIVVASMGDVAASGGYWLASQADVIVANPATITGSIGVIMTMQNWEELYRKIGIKQENFKSGELKDMGTPVRELAEEERAILQALVDDIFEQFVDVVASGRRMERAAVLAVADGRVFTGRQALELGLVDELGNFHRAINVAADLAGLPADPPVKEMGRTSPFGLFFSGLSGLLDPGLFNSGPASPWENIR